MKVAFTGSSGSGKTTLVKFVEDTFGLQHLSGSSGHMVPRTETEKEVLESHGGGHKAVIKYGAMNPQWGITNQLVLAEARKRLILENDNFVTDRSPVDNLVYMIAQQAWTGEIGDNQLIRFKHDCLATWKELTHVIYVKALIPIEDNNSRVSNFHWQRSIDAQFDYWIQNFFLKRQGSRGPKLYIIAYSDLELRKRSIYNFLKANF